MSLQASLAVRVMQVALRAVCWVASSAAFPVRLGPAAHAGLVRGEAVGPLGRGEHDRRGSEGRAHALRVEGLSLVQGAGEPVQAQGELHTTGILAGGPL